MVRMPKKYSIEEMLPKIGVGKRRIKLDGDTVNIRSKTLRNFKEHGTKCVSCGVEGKYFVKERLEDRKNYFLSLYGVKYGKEVLMTRDHIIPKAKGGIDNMENFQTMCFDCNSNKGDIMGDINVNKIKLQRFIKNISRIIPTILFLVLGIILLEYKIYIFGGILTFLGTYPIAHYFSIRFSKGMKKLFKVDIMN